VANTYVARADLVRAVHIRAATTVTYFDMVNKGPAG
jgi:hypothetical protein